MDTADLHLLTGAYALDALDPAERLKFEEHLAGCATCTQEVRELRATAARLGAASSETPPAALRDTVLAQVRATPQQLPLTIDGAAADAGVGVVVEMRRRRSAVLLPVAAAVLAVALVAVGSLAASLQRSNADLRAQAARVTSVLTAPDATTSSGAIGTGGRGTVVVSHEVASAVFVANGLAQPGTGRTYQLWFIDPAGSARSGGTFIPSADGSVVQPLDGSPAGSTTIGLTVEPQGGSAAPTTKPVLAVPVTA